ncbi:hypothetical protein BOTNAR_0245g00190 [Botryotinia narcissicola]|uniref:Charged multivesicular body protein 6 n=1 Tax=Botryotinia narcissicola TaxID=278944 RepID=A0A4Z1I3Z2_9HELO|nr:hypothetical protein BOTNAR_0245g00190 [Botryotinia narcissicola]
MGNTPSTHKISAQDKAILDMKNQRDKLHQYQRRITVLTDRETVIAKEMLAKGDKKRALLALRRKKYQESLLAKTDAQLEQLEKLTSSVEFALVQKDVVFGLQQGTNVLNQIHKEMGGLDHVEKLMGETADAIAYQQASAISYEVEDELVVLEAEVTGVPLPEVPTAGLPLKDSLPDVPRSELSSKDRAKARQREREEQQVAMLA